MPEPIFRLALPLLWLVLLGGLAVHRRQVMRRLGRDPVLIRPWRAGDGPRHYLERALSLGTVALTLDVALNAASPAAVASAIGVPLLRGSRTAGWTGLALVGIGYLIGAVAVRQMGASWRVGIDHQAPGPLVARGLFARVRHPIYGGMLLATAGMAGLTADLLSVAVAAAAWVGLPVQARLEEEFLLSRHPAEYRAYVERTGRFWPRIG